MAAQAHVNAIKISTNAAQYFVDSYYAALNDHRGTITSFYMDGAEMPGGKPLPTISFNGNQIPDALAMQTMFEQQMPQSHYQVQCYDCHVVNPNYIAEGTQGWPAKTGKNMTILVAVSGYVKYGDPKEAKPRAFSETFLLVPNPAAAVSKQRLKNVKEWLIQTQNFRIVV
ncbi:MAG: hypothetical protein L6R39_004558 [Caloplaca ligustica]|nr:MAG: hypothetical protein L6R39_004558 [Caloplaca ligustica]